MPQTHSCPKCGRTLQASGETDVEGGPPLPVYQCDECISIWTVEGEDFETALTFAVDQRGRVVDPESLEPLDVSK